MTELRVKQVRPADPNYVHNPTEPEIPANPNHGGLRVIEHGKFPLVEGHPSRTREAKHPEHDSLAALGSRERN
jgi:hypothetical protein